MKTKKKNIIKDIRTGKLYFDDSEVEAFEQLIESGLTLQEAKENK